MSLPFISLCIKSFHFCPSFLLPQYWTFYGKLSIVIHASQEKWCIALKRASLATIKAVVCRFSHQHQYDYSHLICTFWHYHPLWTHLSIADFRAEMHLPKLRPIRFCTHRYVVCIMGKKKKFQRDRRKKIAKVATGNRQNRHMAEFRQTWEINVVEHQILCGKLVSQA